LPAANTPEGKQVVQANGSPPEDEYARDRVGWAPRFGTGDPADDEGDTLLDHQTFLEGKLDDKFFGDWYHNTGVIIFACLSSWVIALLGGGLGWVFLVMAICGTYYRTSIRRVRRNFRDDVNRELAKARLETDTESLEWINSFLVKFWPIYAPELCKTIIASVDQVLSTSTPAFLDSLRMKTFILGTKPPRMEHVKTYPKADDDIVLMDWKFSFTPTDTMDLTARQLKNKINPKVVLEIRIGKAMISKGLDVIVEDFAFSGLMRVKVKLQLPFPHIEKIDICFIGKPEIDYVCKPLGGDTLGFDINFIPGLETFITEQIHGNLQPIMYDPNVFPIEIAKILAGNPVDLAIGVVAVTIHGAHGLKNPDKFSGTPDPYTAVSLNRREPLGQTKTIKENANPRWNETLYIIITNFTDALTMQVYDWNEFRKDKELGTATFALDQLEQNNEHENLHLEVMANGKPRGQLQADVRFFPVLEGTKLEDGTLEPPPESNTGIARITVEQAKELDGSKSLVGALNPYAALLLNGKEIHVTKKLKRTNNPIFPDPTKSVLITDRKKARLGLVIKDDRDIASDPVLGTYQIKMDDMMQLMEKGQQWFNLHGTNTGRVKLMMEWKPVAIKGVTGSGGYVTPIGVMRIHFQNARDIRNLETIGKSDPYARVLLSGIEKGRTVTFKNNLNPDWDEIIYVPMHSTNERITLEVLDQEKLGKDRTLGHIEIPASDYIREGAAGGYEVHDEKKPKSDGLRIHGQGQAKGKLNYTIAFYPTLNVVDPEEEEEELAEEAELAKKTSAESKEPKVGKASLDASPPNGKGPRTSTETPYPPRTDSMKRGTVDTALANGLTNGEKEAGETTPASRTLSKNAEPKIRLGVEDLVKYGMTMYSPRWPLLMCHRIRSACIQDYRRHVCSFGRSTGGSD
jgi:Ca2+-dependent lipid-binding protein